MAEYLAADCLEEIFHYVSVQDLVALSSVSHYYRTVTLKPSLWKHHALKKWKWWKSLNMQLNWRDVYIQRTELDQTIKFLLSDMTRENQDRNIFEIVSNMEDAIDQLLELQKGDPHKEMTVKYFASHCLKVIYRKINEENWKKFLKYNLNDQLSIEIGCIYVSRVQFPDLTIDHVVEQLDNLANLIRDRIDQANTIREKVSVLLDFLFKEENFHGNNENYFDPNNSYINKVLEDKKGIPISLSMLFASVAARVGLKVNFTNFPGHFLTFVKDEKNEKIIIDSFAPGGKILTIHDCQQLLLPRSFDPKYLEQVSVIEVYLRQYRNLLNIFSDEQPEVALEILHNILVLSPNDYRSRFMRARLIFVNSMEEIATALEDFYFLSTLGNNQLEIEIGITERILHQFIIVSKQYLDKISFEQSSIKNPSNGPVVKYKIGQLFLHQHLHCRSVICGWDIQENQVFYQGINEEGIFSALQDHITIEQPPFIPLPYKKLGRYFCEFDSLQGYKPNSLLLEQYPNL